MAKKVKSMARGACYTYMVQCKYGTYYAGWTNDLTKRIAAHNNGTGAKYLRGKGPVKLVYKKKFLTSQKAQIHERMLKNLTKKQKIGVIAKSGSPKLSFKKIATSPPAPRNDT